VSRQSAAAEAEHAFRLRAGLCARCGKSAQVAGHYHCEPCLRDDAWARTNQAYEKFALGYYDAPRTAKSARIERMMKLAAGPNARKASA